MFSFIRKFFERRRILAAERDRLCRELTQRLAKVLSDFIDVDKGDKGAVQKWRSDNADLIAELSDIGRFKRSSFYRLLKYQKKKFDEFWAQAVDAIQVAIKRERQKRADAEYVSKKLNQWTSEQKHQKIKASKPKSLKRNLENLIAHPTEPSFESEKCFCCGKDGKRKMLYSTEGEALIVAEYRSKEIGIPLHVYPCPNGCGFHLTSNQF